MRIMPARAEQESDPVEKDLICDLDVISERESVFVFRGKQHLIEPVTGEVFFKFYERVLDFQKKTQSSLKMVDADFLLMLRPLCKSITLEDVQLMTLVQKASLVEALIYKVTGRKDIADSAKKKNLA